MKDDKDKAQKIEHADNEQQKQEPLTVQNPFKSGEDKKISQEDLDNEQEFKESLTERD